MTSTIPPGPIRARDAVRPLLKTRQVRQFTDRELDDESLDAIVDATRWSGSSRNEQPWRFVVIRDREKLRRLHEVGVPQTRSLASATAALAIVLPNDPDRAVSRAYDEGRAAERALIAAGLVGAAGGIAWIRQDVRPAIGEVLGLPEDRFVRTIVALGYPTDDARRPKTEPGAARLPREQTVFAESWPAGDEDSAPAG
jgi:nitroreductase